MKISPSTLSALIGAAYIALPGLAGAADTTPVQNACPKDGCEVSIVSVEAADSELKIEFKANYAPEVARNHIHIYWDTYSSDQVSKDAKSRGVVQGNWHPTGDYPIYITQSDASVSARDSSTTLCVTAADRDHNVIDSSIVQCVDVGDKL